MFSLRHKRELEHNKNILENAEKVWGREGKAGKERIKRRAEMIIKKCNIDGGKIVLEIGCGTGTLTQYLVETGARVTATDFDERFIELAKNRVIAKNAKFKTADAESLDSFSQNSFDVVCGVSVLHHLNMNPALKNIWRILRPGGLIAFSEPNMLNPQIALQKNIPFVKKWLGDSPDETAFFKWRIARLLREHSFKDILVEPFDFLHPALPNFLERPFNCLSLFLEKIPSVRELAGSLFIAAQKPFSGGVDSENPIR